MKVFSERLKDELQVSGLTESALGAKIGIGQSTINKWKNNQLEPNLENLAKLCKALDISADYLLGID